MRKLRPCGTHAAYARHLYNNEEPCDACKAANVDRVNAAPSGKNDHVIREDLKFRKALEKDPPVIEWIGGLVKRGVILHDPHADHPNQVKPLTEEERDAQRRARRAELERQRRQRTKEFGAVLAERIRKPAVDEDSPLLAAARTEL